MPGTVTLSFGCAVAASTPVTINYYTPFNVGCYNYLTFAAASSVAVNTDVSVTINWYGDLGGYMSGTVIIYSGTSCNTASFYSGGGVNCAGENETSNSAYVSPSVSGSQTYSIGSQYNIGYAPC
jgi:hypothetical protein